MPSLSAVLSSLVPQSWGNDARLSETPNQSTLAGLPAELLLLIADYLPPIDVVCVSLRTVVSLLRFTARITSCSHQEDTSKTTTDN